jgi:insertion element IS1 protein InsB
LLSFEKKEVRKVNPYILDKMEANSLSHLEVELHYYATEWDEFWSYVGSKANQRWTWYLIERQSGIIIAWENGRRKDKILQKLLDSVSHIPITICHTDDWGAYNRLFPPNYTHLIGKDNTWKIERKNLNFRTHIKRLNRKTICFSKNSKIHDNVIGMYIGKYYFKQGLFSQAFAS